MFDGVLIAMLGAVLLLAGIAWMQGGAELVRAGLGKGADHLLRFGLLVAVSFLAAGLAEVLIPSHVVPRAFGADSGLRGIALATAAGAATPSGPFIAIPIAAALVRAGAGPAAIVAYVSGWGLLAVHRLVAWEIPILGPRLALMRWALCLALPLVAGLAARWLTRHG